MVQQKRAPRGRPKKSTAHQRFPLLPLREIVVFPHMMVPLLVGREKSIAAVEKAMKAGRMMVVAAQKQAQVEEPQPSDIFEGGTLAEILQVLKLSDGTMKILVEGRRRVRVKDFVSESPIFAVRIESVEEISEESAEMVALMRSVADQFEQYVKLNPRTPSEVIASAAGIDDGGRLADTITSHLTVKVDVKQSILEEPLVKDRLHMLAQILNSETEVLDLELKIHGQVRKQMEKSQKEYYLHEQMRAIQKELGTHDEVSAEIEELRKRVSSAKMSTEAEEKALHELERLARMMPTSPEATVVHSYLDWLINMPWAKRTRDNLDIDNAARILDEDHYGLEKPKERILEFLAVRRLVKSMKGPMLCLVGPPGVGKTSLARSIARALGRNFVRVSLGGVRDEAEVRGHRRTYIGAMPGRIIQWIRKAKTRNPVFLMDEVDKMSVDFRGDPSAALLEVLDPEQNSTFNDHYLEVDFDLSDVFFITTANVRDAIPPALQDRMEIIRLSGYTEMEKLKIAELFLVPKQLKANGLKKRNILLPSSSIRKIIHQYTREAGVRNLERELASIFRKVAKAVVQEGPKTRVRITPQTLHKYLGRPKFRQVRAEEKNEIGVAVGLAWTEAGGDIMATEASVMPGKGKLTLTGQLGEVMQESGQAALSYVRSRARELGLKEDFYKSIDVHIHVPEGAIPKDGPSAGVTMAVALVSALTRRPVRKEVAMTGEVTLRGRVLPVGGVKSKVLAAHRAEMKTVVLPEENKRDLEDIPQRIRRQIKFIFAKDVDAVLKAALAETPKQRPVPAPAEEPSPQVRRGGVSVPPPS